MKHFSFILLLLIVLLGLSLRFYNLGGVPAGFHRDEAFFGYNAYALLQTGHDMTGDFLPMHLKSFLFSPAGYSYLSILFIALFGLTEFSVRFASALFGTLTILVTYFLVKELFEKYTTTRSSGNILALLSSFFLAISPWHINLSRVATENVLVVSFIALGFLLYLKWLKKEKFWLLLVSFLCFAITLLLYQAPRAFLPLFLPLLIAFFHPKPWKKKVITPIILFSLIIIIPIATILTSHDLTQRLRMLSIFQNPATQLVLDEQIREDGGGGSPLFVTRLFHNKAINYSETFFSNYFNHFSYDFLFTDKGFPDRYRIAQMGLLYFFELPLLLLGMWFMFAKEKKLAFFLTLWILLAPLGSAFTYDDIPNLQRTLVIFPALSIVTAYGFLQLWQLLSKLKASKILQGLVILIIFYGFLYYLHQYFVHQINHRPWFRQEGYKQLVKELGPLESEYKKIVITGAESDPAIFFLFYNRLNPVEIQNQFKNNPTDAYGQIPLGNYRFVREECPLHFVEQLDSTKPSLLSGENGILYINGGNCKINDERVQTIAEIQRNDGTVVFTLQSMKE